MYLRSVPTLTLSVFSVASVPTNGGNDGGGNDKSEKKLAFICVGILILCFIAGMSGSISACVLNTEQVIIMLCAINCFYRSHFVHPLCDCM